MTAYNIAGNNFVKLRDIGQAVGFNVYYQDGVQVDSDASVTGRSISSTWAAKEPEITIFKEDSVAGAPIEGAKFHVTYTSNGEDAEAPASADYGYLFTDANGEIKLHEQGKKLYPGEYTITEVAPAPGFQMKEPTTQTVIIHGNESKTVTFPV